MRFNRPRRGFTLIELVIVIGIIGLLAALAIPKFYDLTGQAKVGATKAGLGSLRSLLAVRYAQSATAGGTPAYPGSLSSTSFAGAELPKNAINNLSGVTALDDTVDGTATHATLGFWYVSDPANADLYGKSGAYSDGTATYNTENY